MQKKIIMLLVGFCSFFTLQANIEYMYPVASFGADSDECLVLWQHSLTNIELLRFNAQTKQTEKVLLSTFLPTKVKILPGGQGFSFLDAGRLRIKYFYKRSPKTIHIEDTVSRLQNIQWINENLLYCNAKQGYHYKLFCVDLEEEEVAIVLQDESNILDSWVGDTVITSVFHHKHQYEIVQCEKSALANRKSIYQSQKHLGYIHMNDDNSGFFLEYETDQDWVHITCCKMEKSAKAWTVKKLFTYMVPMEYIVGSGQYRVFDSLQAFVPSYVNDSTVLYPYFYGVHGSYLKKYCEAEPENDTVASVTKKHTSLCLAPMAMRQGVITGMQYVRNTFREIGDRGYVIDLPIFTI